MIRMMCFLKTATPNAWAPIRPLVSNCCCLPYTCTLPPTIFGRLAEDAAFPFLPIHSLRGYYTSGTWRANSCTVHNTAAVAVDDAMGHGAHGSGLPRPFPLIELKRYFRIAPQYHGTMITALASGQKPHALA
jgi:hypothetical protein